MQSRCSPSLSVHTSPRQAEHRRSRVCGQDAPPALDLLFEYFIDKIFVGATTLTITSWFFDHGAEFALADLDEGSSLQRLP